MILEELAYKVTVRAEDFLSGKKKVEEGAKGLNKDIHDSMKDSEESVSDVTDEVKKAGNQLKRTSEDTKRPFGLISGGFFGAAKGAKEFGDQGKDAFSTVQAGAAKFLGLALSIEGTRRMFTSAVNNAVDLKNVSSFLDMDPKAVDGWKKGAESVGSSADAISNAMLRMKNAKNWSVAPMSDPDDFTKSTLVLGKQANVDIIGAKDPGEMFRRAEEALRKLPKEQAETWSQRLGFDNSLLPSILDGSLDKNQNQFQNSSQYSDKMAEQAVKVKMKMVDLDQAIDGVGYSLVSAFGDDAIQIMETFNQWVSANGGQVIDFFKDATGWAKQFTEALSGNKNAMHGWGQITDNFNLFTGFKKPVFDLKTLLNGNYDTQTQSSLNNVHDIMSGKGPLPPSSFAPLSAKDGFAETAGTSLWDRVTGLFSEEPTQHAQSARRNRAMGEIMDAVMMTESRGNPNAVSPAGAVGAYQFMPDTARDMGLRVDDKVDERRDPVKSRSAATKYMNQLINRYGGDIGLALMAYNGGMGRVDNALKGKGNPLAKETMDYPGKVADYYQQLQQMAGMQGVAGMQTQTVDNSQSSATHINNVNITSNPQSIDEIAKSIDEQRRRSSMTGAFISGNG
ncbi:lytic transglycosylase domain-containing protein [Rahnella inusitata]|uniref:lytic transglycosylase domain-containing protein n=1 Tax=Rahnella inusitata TaxID=58169 RepID=UPI0039B029D5